MRIKWLGHACFLITTEDGLRILTDPYESGSFEGAIGHEPVTDEADVVLVSHDHADHNHVEGLTGSPEVVREAGSAKGINFEVVETYHDESSGAQRGRNRIFCFEADGLRVCHCGDLGHVLSREEAAAVGRPDVLLIPVGGTYTADAAAAAEVVEQINARLVIPMHFKTPKIGFPISGVEDFLKGKSNVERLDGSELEVSAGELAEEQTTVVLRPAN